MVRKNLSDDLMETNSSSVSSNVKYAAVLINTSQLEQISQNHEHLIVVIMEFLAPVFNCQCLSGVSRQTLAGKYAKAEVPC